MRIIVNCIKHRYWRMAWKMIKFDWRWRNFSSDTSQTVKKSFGRAIRRLGDK